VISVSDRNDQAVKTQAFAGNATQHRLIRPGARPDTVQRFFTWFGVSRRAAVKQVTPVPDAD
jgi:hypothetical protein